MKKKQYIIPQVEVLVADTALMEQGSKSPRTTDQFGDVDDDDDDVVGPGAKEDSFEGWNAWE